MRRAAPGTNFRYFFLLAIIPYATFGVFLFCVAWDDCTLEGMFRFRAWVLVWLLGVGSDLQDLVAGFVLLLHLILSLRFASSETAGLSERCWTGLAYAGVSVAMAAFTLWVLVRVH
jgi:hypothetical protein